MTVLLSLFVLAASTFGAPPAPSAPAFCASAPAPVEQASFSGVTTKSICIADCGSAPDVSCEAPSCTAVNQSCPGERGRVTCGTTTFWCPPCPCTEGSFKFVSTGPNCSCPVGESWGTPKDLYRCIGGVWVYQSSDCSFPFCQG